MSKPSNVELDAIKEHLFLFRPDSETRLAPVNHDAATNARFRALASDPLFDKLGLAIVVHPPAGPNGTSPPPQAFLNNAGDNWDIGSAGKLSLPLAALVLRRDVQRLVTAGVVTKTTPAEKLDALFQYVWLRHPSPAIAALATGKHWPSPSRVLDWSGDSVVIQGRLPNNDTEWADLDRRSGSGHIAFRDLAQTTITEFLLLTIGKSDNVAARVCQGALGVGFADAVIEKLGLFEWASPSWTLGGGAGEGHWRATPRLPRLHRPHECFLPR